MMVSTLTFPLPPPRTFPNTYHPPTYLHHQPFRPPLPRRHHTTPSLPPIAPLPPLPLQLHTNSKLPSIDQIIMGTEDFEKKKEENAAKREKGRKDLKEFLRKQRMAKAEGREEVGEGEFDTGESMKRKDKKEDELEVGFISQNQVSQPPMFSTHEAPSISLLSIPSHSSTAPSSSAQPLLPPSPLPSAKPFRAPPPPINLPTTTHLPQPSSASPSLPIPSSPSPSLLSPSPSSHSSKRNSIPISPSFSPHRPPDIPLPELPSTPSPISLSPALSQKSLNISEKGKEKAKEMEVEEEEEEIEEIISSFPSISHLPSPSPSRPPPSFPPKIVQQRSRSRTTTSITSEESRRSRKSLSPEAESEIGIGLGISFGSSTTTLLMNVSTSSLVKLEDEEGDDVGTGVKGWFGGAWGKKKRSQPPLSPSASIAKADRVASIYPSLGKHSSSTSLFLTSQSIPEEEMISHLRLSAEPEDPLEKHEEGGRRSLDFNELVLGVDERRKSRLIGLGDEGVGVIGEGENEGSDESDLDMDASLKSLAYRAGLMKGDLVGDDDEWGMGIGMKKPHSSRSNPPSNPSHSRTPSQQQLNHRPISHTRSPSASSTTSSTVSSSSDESFDLMFTSNRATPKDLKTLSMCSGTSGSHFTSRGSIGSVNGSGGSSGRGSLATPTPIPGISGKTKLTGSEGGMDELEELITPVRSRSKGKEIAFTPAAKTPITATPKAKPSLVRINPATPTPKSTTNTVNGKTASAIASPSKGFAGRFGMGGFGLKSPTSIGFGGSKMAPSPPTTMKAILKPVPASSHVPQPMTSNKPLPPPPSSAAPSPAPSSSHSRSIPTPTNKPSSSSMTPSSSGGRKSRQNSTTSTTSSIFTNTDRSTALTSTSFTNMKVGRGSGGAEDAVSESGSEIGSVGKGSEMSFGERIGLGIRGMGMGMGIGSKAGVNGSGHKKKKSEIEDAELMKRLSAGSDGSKSTANSYSNRNSSKSSSSVSKFGFSSNSSMVTPTVKSKVPGPTNKTTSGSRSTSPLRKVNAGVEVRGKRSLSIEGSSQSGKSSFPNIGKPLSQVDSGVGIADDNPKTPVIRSRLMSLQSSTTLSARAPPPESEEMEELVDEWGRAPKSKLGTYIKPNSAPKPLALPSAVGKISATSPSGNRDSIIGSSASPSRPRFPLPYTRKAGSKELNLSLSLSKGQSLLPGSMRGRN